MGLCLWCVVATALSAAPRYEKVSQLLVVLSVLALALLDRRLWPAVGGASAATATFLLATAGVVAGLSLDEAFSLLSTALLLGLLATVASALQSSARHAAD